MQSVIETPVQVELLTSSEPGPWTWEIDGVSIAVEQAVAVEVSFTAQGETSEQQIHLAALEDGSLGWFSDCGDPTLIPPPLVAMALDGGFTVCGSGCSLREKIVEAQKIHVWCMNDSACTSRGCACHLYSLGPGGSPQDPDDWEYETEAGDKILKDNNRDYHCFCVR
jgi:hypothetical protein